MLSVPVLESDVYVKCTVLESDVYVKCTCSGE